MLLQCIRIWICIWFTGLFYQSCQREAIGNSETGMSFYRPKV